MFELLPVHLKMLEGAIDAADKTGVDSRLVCHGKVQLIVEAFKEGCYEALFNYHDYRLIIFRYRLDVGPKRPVRRNVETQPCEIDV
jgi:hypothetical protein